MVCICRCKGKWLNIMTEEKKQQVKKVLLTPIECTTQESVNIFRHNGKIFSSQKYNSKTLDPDMSDMAIEFYNILYRDILESKGILKNEGLYQCTLENDDFAGDTMNSFNSIASNVPRAGQYTKQRTEKKVWPAFLQKYHSQYHCLANFWILPMRIGRARGTKLNKYDSVDIFLNKLKEDFSVLTEYADYFERLKTYDNFCEKHFIVGCRLLPTDAVYEMYHKRLNNKPKTNNLVKQAYKVMESRAESISSNDNICEELYECFDELKILY